MVPPIPTRRTKRKMMTTEDSKPLNTGMNEQTIFIMPPPRRKHKPQHSQPNPNSSSDEHENVFPEETNKDNRVTHVLNSESVSVDRGMSCRPTLTASAEKDLVENPRLPTNKLTDHKVCSELKILNFESNLGVLLDLDGEADSVEQDKKNSSDLTHNHRSCNESNIFEMFIDNRVLDVPLVAGSHEPIDEILEANNEVKMSIPENSATIVGVFYKPEFSSLSKVNECKSDYQQTNLDVDTRVWQKSTVDCSGKATLGVLDEGSKNIENKISIKETEENDSGVYFSDTKSPPFRETYLDHEDLADKEEKNVVNLPHYSSSHYPFNCNDRDTFDNKNLEDFSSKSYRIMLDDFEGQTVKAQRDEVTSLFSVCNGELSKTQVVEDWLDNGKYLLEKKSNSNRNFTEYLKTMLNTESQRDSLSPYPLSTVDEDDRSDIVLDDLQESRLKEVVVRNVLPGASFTKPTSSLDLIESSVSSSNNNRPIDVIVDNVNIFYVNTDCKFAPDKSEHVYSEVQNTPKVVQNPKQNPQKVLVEFDKFTSKVTTKPVTSVENSSVCNLNLDLNLNTLPTPSSAIKQGAVTSLIAYFENIKHQEFEPVYSDEGLSVKEDESVPQSEEDAESESMPSRDLNDSFENYERFLNTTDEIIKDTCEAEDYTNEICCPSVVPKNCKETLTNEQFPEFKDLPKVEALSEDDNQTLYLFENEPEFEVSVSDTNSDFEPQPEGNPTVRTIEKNIYIENRNLQPLKNVESIYEAKYEETKQQLPENTNHSPLSTSLSYSIENQLNDTSVVDLIDNDYLVEVEATVPTICNATKEVVNSEVSLPAFKPTMIPIVVLTEADLETSLIGSIELHSSQQPAKDITDLSPETTEYAQSNQHFENDVESLAKSEIDPAAIEVVLEKNWGSVGLKLQGDDEGVFVSDILPGGSADESGLIFKGDRLLGVNGQCVRTTLDAEELLRSSADVVNLHLQRNGVSASLPRHGVEDTEDTMGSNMSRHSGKGLTGRRSQSQGNLCNGKSPGVARFFSPCGRNNDSVGPRDRYKFCGSLPNHLDSKEHPLEEVCEPDDLTSYRNNNNVRKSDVVLRLQPLVPHGYKEPAGGAQDQGYASERSPEDELPPDLPPPETADQLTCPVHHPANKPLQDYPFLHKNSIFTVTVMKGTRGLGLSVTGGVDTQEPWPGLIRIKRLFPHQPAWQSGQLAQGDFLLAANNISLFRLTNYEALEVLRTTPAEVVLTVCRPPPELQVLSTPLPLPGDTAPLPPRRDPNSTSSLQLPLKRMESFGEFEITLKKVNGSLGFTLRKEDESVLGHYVRALVREPALSDGRVKPGDKIVAVNNVDMSPMSHEEAVLFLRQCGQEVQLKLYRDPAQTPVQALSPTEHHRTFKPILRKEAQDMLSDLAVKKSMSPKDSSSSSTLSSTGRNSSPRKRRLTKTPSPDLEAVRRESQLSWSEEVLERISPGTEGDRPRRPDSLNFTAERKPHFQFSAAGSCKTEESLNSLDSFDCGGSVTGADSEMGLGPLPTEPVSMPPLLTSASDTNVGFSYRNPAYRSANPAPSKSKSSLSEELPEGRSSDNDLTGGDGGVEGSKGLLKWKGVVFTPEDGAENEAGTSPDDSVSQITEVDNGSHQVVVVELNRGWSSRLGFSLKEEDHKTYISAIHPDSVASRDGRLKTGDQLIMVNDEGIDGMSTAEVIDLLRKIRGSICITVWRKL